MPEPPEQSDLVSVLMSECDNAQSPKPLQQLQSIQMPQSPEPFEFVSFSMGEGDNMEVENKTNLDCIDPLQSVKRVRRPRIITPISMDEMLEICNSSVIISLSSYPNIVLIVSITRMNRRILFRWNGFFSQFGTIDQRANCGAD